MSCHRIGAIAGHCPDGVAPESRNQTVQTIGNLTLLAGRFNTQQSNRPWIHPLIAANGKRHGLREHTVLALNRKLSELENWSEIDIEARGQELFQQARRIWPLPPS